MIKEKIDFLINIKDEEWGHYAFSRDPLKNKVADSLKNEMIIKAIECGKEEAKKLRDKYKSESIQEIIKDMKLEVKRKDSNRTDTYIMFACYNSPNKITIYEKNRALAQKFIIDNRLNDAIQRIKVEDILLAHELFHHLEEKNKDIYTRNAEIVLWKIGSYKYKSGLVSLGEIAAMVFTKELFKLRYNPYIFDVLMLYPHDKKRADELYKEIKKFERGLYNE